MANRRMFCKDITESDAFLSMPLSSQALYYHLGMNGDDDGFLASAKKIVRMISASEDDFKLLVAKRFVLMFDGGICVVKHWRMNNQIRGDRYKKTLYNKEMSTLCIKENGSYTEVSKLDTNGIPNGNQMATQYSIVEDSKEDTPPPKKNELQVEDVADYIRKFIEKKSNDYHQVSGEIKRLGLDAYLVKGEEARQKLIKIGYTDAQVKLALEGAIGDAFRRDQIRTPRKLLEKNKGVLYMDVMLDVANALLAKKKKDAMR